MKIELPQFEPNKGERNWVQSENATARFIRAFWSAAGQRRSDPKFVVLLVTFGWLNKSEDWKSTRLWRNQNIADYRRVSYESDEQLGRELTRAFPRLKQATQLLKTDSGITHYYKPFRTATREFVLHHAALLSRTFKQVSEPSSNPHAKIQRAVDTLTDLGKDSYIRTHNLTA